MESGGGHYLGTSDHLFFDWSFFSLVNALGATPLAQDEKSPHCIWLFFQAAETAR